jgi:hypothetical protein
MRLQLNASTASAASADLDPRQFPPGAPAGLRLPGRARADGQDDTLHRGETSMKKAIAIVAACGALLALPAYANPAVNISQVYGGGGATSGSPSYNQDYVEIYNSSGFAVDLSGWTIEYGSATGSWGSSSSNIFTFPMGTSIPGCRYILVGLSSGSVGPALSPAPDFTGTLTLSATSGKVALFSAVNSNLACGSELPGTLVDKVSYGSGNCPENTNVAALSTTTGAVRNGAGATDTEHNLNDFTVVTGPVPRNLASGPNPGCIIIGVESNTWGNIKKLYE